MAFVVREPSRKVHITRILGTNRDGEVLPDIWLDVERFENYAKVTQSEVGQALQGQAGYQQVFSKFRWHDDPEDGEEYRPEDDDGTARNTFVVKVCSPDEADLNDPEQWVPVRVIKAVHLVHGDDVGSDTNQKYITEDLTAERKVKLRRVSHYDTSIDDAAEAAFEADPERMAYVAKSDDYQKDDETKDPAQYIEYELVTTIIKRVSAHPQSFGTDQQVTQHFKNEYLLDETDPAKLEELGENDKNPPYRLDPFQNIINVQWESVQHAVLGIEDFPVSYTDSITETSADGLEWETGFGASSNAATGLGYTVVCSGNKFIVFGKPRDGKSCFITAKDFTIQRGVLDPTGDHLEWDTVASLPAEGDPLVVGVRSLSFAGGAFFVSYLKAGDGAASYLAVSFDGEDFTQNIQPFNGAVAAANGSGLAPGTRDPDPEGGGVAYDKINKVYVTTGKYNRSYMNQQDIGAGDTSPIEFLDENFMSAKSSNGTSWTATFDTSECSGFPPSAGGGIGGDRDGRSNVTFGNGRFVAASSFKLNYNFYTAPSFSPFKLAAYAAAVATSLDGVIWSNARLPGSQSTGWVFGEATASSGGYGVAAKFFKAKKNDSGVSGFFVATAFEYGGVDESKSKLWQSEDGITWTLVRTDIKSDWILSAISKNRGTVVNRD